MHLTEGKVALYSSVIFGAVHLSNALATGTSAIFVSFTGYMLYLTRRWAGVIWLAMPVHGSQDFLISSGEIGVGAAISASFVVLPTMIGLAILLWRRRHRIGLESAEPGSIARTRTCPRRRRAEHSLRGATRPQQRALRNTTAGLRQKR
jgi:hypothetical protein